MKPVLLLHPPFEGKNYLKSRAPFPIGLLYIAAYLGKKGIRSEVFDFSYPPNKEKTIRPKQLQTGQSNYFRFGWTDTAILQWLKQNLKRYYNIIGVSSLMSSNWTGAYRVIDLIKQVDPKVTIIIGGPHATAFPDHVSKYSKSDYICIGEGEESFYCFLKKIKHEGIIKSKIGCGIERKRGFIDDMDLLPFPDRSLLKDDRKTKELYVTFSRGCPQKCSFCGSYLIQGRKWRHKSVNRVLEELKFYYENWGVRSFVMEDDNPCPGKKGIRHLRDICKRIVIEYPKIKFTVSHGLPVGAIADKELSSLLWQSGLRRMSFPVESTSPIVLKDMNKEQVLKYWRKAIDVWSKYEKWNPVQIIIGYPFEQSITTVLRTMMEIAEIKGRIWASHFRLNAGTPLFKRCLDAGYIIKSYDPINTQGFYIETKNFKMKDLKELMQISRAINYATEYDCDPFKKVLDCKYFHSFSIPKKEGDIVARGGFKFRKGQNVAASIMLVATGRFDGRPMVSVGKDNETLVYKGVKLSRVYDELKYILTGIRKQGIRGKLLRS